MQAVKLQASADELTQQHVEPKISGPESAVLLEELAQSLCWLVNTLPKSFKDLEKIVDSTFDELEHTRAELKHSRGELELSRSEAMATQLKLKFKEEEFSEERKDAEKEKRFLKIHVEALEKKLKIESPRQCSKEDAIMQQLAKYFPPMPPSLDIGEKLPFAPYSTFSRVFSGALEGEPVLVKTITNLAFEATGEEEDSETVVSTFAAEFQILQVLNHPHVLSLKEAFHDKASKQLIVVMERAKESLGSYLKAGQGETSYQTQLRICSELIGGLLFLYGCNPPIVHGNLNDANVMMTEEGIVKIDIGDSMLKCNPVNMLHLLPEGLQYLPSEAFTRGHTAEEETDVFSLGVLLLQIATQKAPCVEHDGVGLTPEAEECSDDPGELDDQHPLKPIILPCLQHSPRDRPKVALLCSQVQSLIDREEELVTSTFHELELSRSEAMATQLKLKSKEEEFSEEQKLTGNAKRLLEIRVEELEKKLKINSPGQCTKEDAIMQQLAKHFSPIPPSLEIGEKLPFTPYTTFSTVFSGTLEGEPVMVKTISHLAFEANSEVEDPETVVSTFAAEFRTLQALNHPQVLSLKEAFHDKASKQLIVVMERAKESLGSYLKAGQEETSYQMQLQICSKLIGGLNFLYDTNPPIVHGNLNDVNVLMTGEGIVKIDIGDSMLKCNPVNMLHLLPEGLRYLPSEAFTRGHTAEEETDVFSLGVLFLQIATQKAPCVEHDGVGLTPEAERRSDDPGELDDQHPLKPIILPCLQHFPRDRPKVALLCSQVQSLIDREECISLSPFVDTVPKTFGDLEGIFLSFNKERKDLESALEASLMAVQSLDGLVNGSASLISLEDYHPAPASDATDPDPVQPTASPSAPVSGGSQRLDDKDACTTHEQAIVAYELDPWKRRFRNLLTKHSQLLHAHGMNVDEEMRSLSVSEDEDSISTSTPSQQEHLQRREVSAQQEELSCVQEELSRVREEYARESEEMRKTLNRTTEEQLLPQNEAEGQTGVKDTGRAYHEIGKRHQFVQTTPEEFPPEYGMAEQEMHDEATGKKLISLEEEWVKFEAIARLVKQLKTDLESLRERASRKMKHHTQLKVRFSEKEEQLERQVAVLQSEVDRLSQQLSSAHITYLEADLSSDQVSESFSRVEDAMLMRSESLPEQVVTAYKKIEVLEEINDSLLAEKKEAQSTLERSLKTVQSLDESLEEQRLEKFTALHDIKQLKSLLEDLKERVAKKLAQKSKGDSHSRRLPSPALEDSSLLCEIDSLQKRLASVTDEAAKEVEQTNHARQEMREMKELLDRTVAEKLQLEKEVERLYRAKAEEDAARARTPPSQSQGEGVLMSEVKTLKLELVRVEEELQTARRDAGNARQERREMKDRLDSTFAEKLVLEEQLENQKKRAKDWKMQLDETTAKLLVKEAEIELLQDRLRR